MKNPVNQISLHFIYSHVLKYIKNSSLFFFSMQFFPAKQRKIQFSFTNSANTQQSNSTLSHTESKTWLEFQKPISENNPSHTNSKPTKQFKLWAQHNPKRKMKNCKMGKKERTSISPRRRPMISSVSVDNAWVRHVNHTSSDIFTHVKDIFSLSKKKENFGGRQTDRQREKEEIVKNRILNKKRRPTRFFDLKHPSYFKMLWGSTRLWGCAIIQLLVLCYGSSFN